ncbi:MAG: redox-sensing transcriptional repressor Rex [Oscillospiraceae bacterium]|nr:redox-sensing transcriptional repressor Rex [Oscillospiraceae bacterium]
MNNKTQSVSDLVIRRLPRYYRFLGELAEKGISKISSRELSSLMGLTASQIRQDLNCFGGFGQQGYGYNIILLQEEISKILGYNNLKNTIIIGAGNLGHAIAEGMHFEKRGFNLCGIFDVSKNIIGTKAAGLTVSPMSDLESFCKKKKVSVAVICIPKDSAKSVCKDLISFGIEGIWNFSHCDISEFKDLVKIENVHLGDSLAALGYSLSE